MTLAHLLKLANLGYPDRYLSEYFHRDGSENPDGAGDTLAQFIVRELHDTHDPESSDLDQIDEAVGVLTKAQSDLESIIEILLQAAANRRRRMLHSH